MDLSVAPVEHRPSSSSPPGTADTAGATDSSGEELERPSIAESALFLYAPFLLTLMFTFASTSDDPFITLRYAANLVHGLGFAFNPGQHVQGFTSPLHLLVAVVVYVLPGGHHLLILKLASLVFGLLALHEASRLIFGLALPRWAKRTACVAVATSWIIAFASSNALETTIVVWLLIALARRLVHGGPGRSTITLAVLALGAVLTRLDTLAPIICMAGVGLLVERATPLWRRCSWVGGAVVGALVTLVWEEVFFKTLLPNTYYAKNMPHTRALSMGFEYLIDPLVKQGTLGARVPHGIPAIVLVVQTVFVVAGLYTLIKRFPRCAYLVAIFVGQALFILKSGSDWMRGGRFLAPAVIPFIVIEALGLVGMASYLRPRVMHWMAIGAIALASMVFVTASFLPLASVHAPVWRIDGLDDGSLVASGQYDGLSQVWPAIRDELSCLPAGQLVATSEVGYLGFSRLDLRILDLRGLTGREFARRAPAAEKWPWGVHDLFWIYPWSPVGRAIVRKDPAVIATLDGFPKFDPQYEILDGRYHLVKATYIGAYMLAFYRRTGDTQNCLT